MLNLDLKYNSYETDGFIEKRKEVIENINIGLEKPKISITI